MTNAEIVATLHKMADRIGAMLEEPELEGILPLVRVTIGPDADGDRMRFTVGVESVDEDETP